MSLLVQDPQAAVDVLLARWQRDGMPGMSVGVLHQGRVVARRGYGLADIASGQPNAADVPMRIASLSKQFLVTIVLQLAREGRLSIDHPLQRYLPDLPDYGTPVTLRDLMSNQSGVRDFLELRLLSGGNFSDPATLEQSDDLIRASAELNFAPHSQFAYSNSGFRLLTRVVEQLEQQPLEAVLQRRLLQPLGMKATQLARSDTPWIPGRAVPYVVKDGVPAQGRWSIPLDGAGGMISTVDDLLIWARYVADPASPDADIFAQMSQARPYSDGSSSLYGLGFTVMPWRGQPSFGHHGQLPGVFAEIAWFPALETTLVLLANTTEINPFLLGRQLADELFPAALAARAAGQPLVAGHYYDAQQQRVLTLREQPDGLQWQSVMTRAPLEWHSPGYFRPFWPMLHFQLRPQPEGLQGWHGPLAVTLQRLPAFDPGTLSRWCGSFWQPQLQSRWSITARGDALVLTLSGPLGSSQFHLQPVAEGLMLATPAVDPDGDYRPTVQLIAQPSGKRRLRITTDRTAGLLADEIVSP